MLTMKGFDSSKIKSILESQVEEPDVPPTPDPVFFELTQAELAATSTDTNAFVNLWLNKFTGSSIFLKQSTITRYSNVYSLLDGTKITVISHYGGAVSSLAGVPTSPLLSLKNVPAPKHITIWATLPAVGKTPMSFGLQFMAGQKTGVNIFSLIRYNSSSNTAVSERIGDTIYPCPASNVTKTQISANNLYEWDFDIDTSSMPESDRIGNLQFTNPQTVLSTTSIARAGIAYLKYVY